MVNDAGDNFSYLVGRTASPSMPLIPGPNFTSSPLKYDAYVYKFILATEAVQWGVYYGGTSLDLAEDVELDDNGDCYFVGMTASTDLPQHTTTSFATITGGDTYKGGYDNYIAKLSRINGSLLWANYVGSTSDESDRWVSVTIDHTSPEHIYMAGMTKGSNLLTATLSGTNVYNQSSNNGNSDGYIYRLSKTGSLEWGTYFGGKDFDGIDDILFIPETNGGVTKDHLYIAGHTTSTAYDNVNSCLPPPSTNGGFPNCNTVSGTHLNANTAGQDEAFIAEFNENGVFKWSSFFGGEGSEALMTHALSGYSNNVYLAMTTSEDHGFPNHASCSTCFIQGHNANGDNDGVIIRFIDETLDWFTFFGGVNGDNISSIKCSGTDVFITGTTWNSPVNLINCGAPVSGKFSLCNLPGFFIQNSYNILASSNCNAQPTQLNCNDGYIASFNSSNQLTWSTLIGGSKLEWGYDLEFDLYFTYLVGTTGSHYITSNADDYPQSFLPGAYNQNVNNGMYDGLYTRFDNSLAIRIPELENIANGITIYPNPTSTMLNVKIDLELDIESFEVRNVLGALVSIGTINAETTEISTSKLAEGMYMLILKGPSFNLNKTFIKE